MLNIIKNYSNYILVALIFYYFILYTVFGSLYMEYNQGIYIKVSFFLLTIFLFRYFVNNYNKFLVFIFLILYMLIYLIYYFYFREPYITNEVLWFQAKIILYAIMNILLAIVFYQNLNNRFFKISIIIGIFILCFFTLYNVDYSNFKYTFNHQLIGGILPLLSIFIASLIKNRVLKVLFMTLILVLLFFIKSRASFYSFILIFIIFLIKEIGFKLFLYIILGLIVFFLILNSFDVIVLDKRMLGVNNIINDWSFNERVEQFKYGFEAIKNNWFLGQYSGQVIKTEGSKYEFGIGSYMHNWFSFWRQFGIMFFIIFTIFYFSRLFMIFKLWINNYKYSDFIFYLGLYMSVNILLFHSYNYPYIWFVLTIMHLYLIDSKKYVEK